MRVCAGLCGALVKCSLRPGDTPEDEEMKAVFVPSYTAAGIVRLCAACRRLTVPTAALAGVSFVGNVGIAAGTLHGGAGW
eukprot:gene8049-19977_t